MVPPMTASNSAKISPLWNIFLCLISNAFIGKGSSISSGALRGGESAGERGGDTKSVTKAHQGGVGIGGLQNRGRIFFFST